MDNDTTADGFDWGRLPDHYPPHTRPDIVSAPWLRRPTYEGRDSLNFTHRHDNLSMRGRAYDQGWLCPHCGRVNGARLLRALHTFLHDNDGCYYAVLLLPSASEAAEIRKRLKKRASDLRKGASPDVYYWSILTRSGNSYALHIISSDRLIGRLSPRDWDWSWWDPEDAYPLMRAVVVVGRVYGGRGVGAKAVTRSDEAQRRYPYREHDDLPNDEPSEWLAHPWTYGEAERVQKCAVQLAAHDGWVIEVCGSNLRVSRWEGWGEETGGDVAYPSPQHASDMLAYYVGLGVRVVRGWSI